MAQKLTEEAEEKLAAQRRRITQTIEAADDLSRRLIRAGQLRSCPVHRQFFDVAEEGTHPPLLLVLGNSDVRLKLYLSLLWASPGGDHDTNFAAGAWAKLLGLENYGTSGKRRIQRAVEELENEGFVAVERRSGRPVTVTVLREDGSGRAYSKPSATAKAGRYTYINVPHTWWTNGWIAHVSAKALSMWMFIHHIDKQATTNWVWLPQSTTTKHGFSPNRRQQSISELKRARLIETWRDRSNYSFAAPGAQYKVKITGALDHLPFAIHA